MFPLSADAYVWRVEPDVRQKYNHGIDGYLSLTQRDRRLAANLVWSAEIVHVAEIGSRLRLGLGGRKTQRFHLEHAVDETSFGENETTLGVNAIVIFLQQ